MEMTADQIRLGEIFHPLMFEQMVAVKSSGTRFVHYTRADAAMNILRTKEVWMRKTSCMDDFTEVQYGLECLAAAYNGEVGKRFKAVLDSIFAGLSNEIEKLFNGWQPHFEFDTYILCVSEHVDEEDTFGRLSMWRAYGSATGVALVLNNAPFLSPSEALKAYSSPVAYLTKKGIEKELEKIAGALEKDSDFVRVNGRQTAINYVFNAFRFAALCTKHPGFREEREWRVVYTPEFDKSDRLIKDIQVIEGVPQPIYKLPLSNILEEGLVGVEISEIIDRIIIGPTQYPGAVREAFENLLAEAGVDEPASRVLVSDIPLR